MPQPDGELDAPTVKPLGRIVEEVGVYPPEAFEFVRRGLQYTADKIHGVRKVPDASRHISGQDLCAGLRELAVAQWGYMARLVLNWWHVRRTEDFGKIVFALVQGGDMAKTPDDCIDDFNNGFNFAELDADYRFDAALIRKRLGNCP